MKVGNEEVKEYENKIIENGRCSQNLYKFINQKLSKKSLLKDGEEHGIIHDGGIAKQQISTNFTHPNFVGL